MKFCCRGRDLSPPSLKHFTRARGYALRTRNKESTALRSNAKPGSPPMPRSCDGGMKSCCHGRDLSPPELKKRFVSAGGPALRPRSVEGWIRTTHEEGPRGELGTKLRLAPQRNVCATWPEQQKPPSRRLPWKTCRLAYNPIDPVARLALRGFDFQPELDSMSDDET